MEKSNIPLFDEMNSNCDENNLNLQSRQSFDEYGIPFQYDAAFDENNDADEDSDGSLEEINFETGEVISKESDFGKKKTPVVSLVFDWFEVFSFALAMMVLMFMFVFRHVTVDGTSMLNTLQHEDRLIVWSAFYTPERNDIVIVNCDSRQKPLVKRVIGIGNDVVKINYDTWQIWVNGEEIDQSYLEGNVHKDSGYRMHEIYGSVDDGWNYQLLADGCAQITVEEGKVFVLGDNRNNSTDSRALGQFSVEDVVGKVAFRISPLETSGKVS